MSSITGLISGGGGGGTPINGVGRFNKPTSTQTFTDESGQVWLRMGIRLDGDNLDLYPDADVQEEGMGYYRLAAISTNGIYGPTTDYNPTSMDFKPDGTMVYVLTGGRNIVEFQLTTAWDVSTFAYNNVKVLVTGLIGNFRSIKFKPDGTKVFIARSTGTGTQYISEFSLSTPWDLSTLSNTYNYDITEYGTNEIFSMAFSGDGSWFALGSPYESYVRFYTMTTPWDLSTASHNINDLISGLTNIYNIKYVPSKNRIYLINSSKRYYGYTLTNFANWVNVENNINVGFGSEKLVYFRDGFEKLYSISDSSPGYIYDLNINKYIGYITMTNFVNTDYMRIK